VHAPRASHDSTLATQVYDDQAQALTRRLQTQQAEHGRVVEAVARGELDSAEIARSRGHLRTTREELEDLAALQAHVHQVNAARAARNRVQGYYQVVDSTEAALAQAREAARAIDDGLEALGTAVGRFRAQVQVCDALTRAALVTGGRRLLDDVSVWSSQRGGLEAEMLTRLRSLRVLTDQNMDPAAQERRVATWCAAWSSRLIDVARQQGPALLDDEDAARGAA
jgi:hypothetical protein